MNSINNIEIIIDDCAINIVPSTLKVYFKDKVKDISKETIEKIVDIICTWDRKYISNNVIDAIKCRINVCTNKGIDEYYLDGKYPNTFNELYDIVRDIYE